MYRRLTALFLLALCGCVQPPLAAATPIHTADGSLQYFVECAGASSNCINMANQTCSRGYQILVPPQTTTAVNGTPMHGGTWITSENYTTMTINCVH